MGAPTGIQRTARLSAGALLALGAAAVAAAPARPLGCLIEPDRVADLGAQVVGVVQAVHAERGDAVKAGQPLLALRADVERAHRDVAQRRAAVDADVRAADASLALARQKVSRAEALVRQGFVSDQALDLARAEQTLAEQKLQQVHAQREIWAREQRVAEAQLALRTIHSPFDGVIAERFVGVGERVEDRPLLRVAVIDPLRVELMVPTSMYGKLSPGDELGIQPELPGVGTLQARVRQVDRVFDAASNSFRVRLTLPNPGGRLPAGLRCKAELGAAADAAAPAPRAAPASRSAPPG